MSDHESRSADGSDEQSPDAADALPVETLQTYAKRGIDSGAAAGVLGGLFVVRGIGALREGAWLAGVAQLLLGTLLLAVARVQYRAPAERRPGTGETPRGDRPPTGEGVTGVDRGPYERLGAAAFDEYSNEVPAPQQAFDREFLSPHKEVYWGIGASSDPVVCTQSYDDLDDLPGVDYVASSRVDEERTVSVPDRIVDHWNELAGTDVGVPGGTGIVFATSDTLARHHCLAVVPEPWVDDIEWA